MKPLATAFLCLALAACSVYPERPPQPALHDFGPSPALAPLAATDDPHPNPGPRSARPAGERSEGLGDTVAAALVSVDAPTWLRDDRLRYRLLYNDPTLVRFYALDAWIAPPPALLAQRLRAAVDTGKYRFKLALTDFEQVFDTPASAHVVLNFRAAAESADGKQAGERQFHYVQPCPSPDAKGAVSAYAATVEQAAGDVKAWLGALR